MNFCKNNIKIIEKLNVIFLMRILALMKSMIKKIDF